MSHMHIFGIEKPPKGSSIGRRSYSGKKKRMQQKLFVTRQMNPKKLKRFYWEEYENAARFDFCLVSFVNTWPNHSAMILKPFVQIHNVVF